MWLQPLAVWHSYPFKSQSFTCNDHLDLKPTSGIGVVRVKGGQLVAHRNSCFHSNSLNCKPSGIGSKQ